MARVLENFPHSKRAWNTLVMDQKQEQEQEPNPATQCQAPSREGKFWFVHCLGQVVPKSSVWVCAGERGSPGLGLPWLCIQWLLNSDDKLVASLGDQMVTHPWAPVSMSKWSSVTQPGFLHQQETCLPSSGSYSICSRGRNAGQEQTRRRWVQLCTCHSALSCWDSCCASVKHNPRAGTEDSLSCGNEGVLRALAGPLQQAGATGPFCYWEIRDYNPPIKVSSQRLTESRWAGLCQHPWRRKREMEGWKRKNKNSMNTYYGPGPWDMYHP